MKKFFTDRGIKASGGMGLTANERNGFQSFDYSSPADRDKSRRWPSSPPGISTRSFWTISIFSNNKGDDAIAAKGDKSWTQFRMELMDEVSKNLIIGPAKAVNPKVPPDHQVSQLVRELPGPGLRSGGRAENL